MKSSTFGLPLLSALAAFSLTACIKTPVRTGESPAFRSGDSADIFPPREPGAASVIASKIPDRDQNIDLNRGDRTALHAVYFEYDRSDIRSSEREKLKVAKDYLEARPGRKLVLEGYCDWRGTAEYNLGLGDRRASAVRSYLLSMGVSTSRLEIVSKGSLEAASHVDGVAMAKDRRVEFIVLDSTR